MPENVTLRILIAGASGLIGKALQEHLLGLGMDVCVLVRKAQQADGKGKLFWNPEERIVDRLQLEGFDCWINLAGEPIASGRWTQKKKKKLLFSRLLTTAFLVELAQSLSSPPSCFINASAIGYYGNRGSEEVDEGSKGGEDFLSQVCQKWEGALEPLSKTDIRVVKLRTGIVLSKKGGALKAMLFPFKIGLGGKIGSGTQFMSWIAIDDLVAIISFVISHRGLKGAVNCVSPHPVTNRTFTEALAKTLGRPAFAPVPAFALRFLMGEMAEVLLLSSTRVKPRRLMEWNFPFRYPHLEQALKHLLD